MREAILRDFLIRVTDAESLRRDLIGAVVQTSTDVFSQYITPATGEFEVTGAHLVRLCDAVLAGELPAPELEKVGFCLVASDFFKWDSDTEDGARVAETVYDWSAPEINYRLIPETVAKFRHRLLTGIDTFTRDDFPQR